VLLRPEADEAEDGHSSLERFLPQDAPPPKKRWFWRKRPVKS
jgi:hypothetical protein